MSKTWYHIARCAANPKKAQIKIHGIIGYWDISAQLFLAELERLGDVSEIELSVDSPGGSIPDGFAIYNALEQHPARITATVIGTAASMASVVILAADEIRIPKNGWIMVHRARGGADGTHEEVAAAAEVIRQMEDQVVRAYVARTGQKEFAIREMMNTLVGTWMNGETAVEKGFADTVIPGVKATAFADEWRSRFDFLPVALFDTTADVMSQTTTSPAPTSSAVVTPPAPGPTSTPPATPAPAPANSPGAGGASPSDAVPQQAAAPGSTPDMAATLQDLRTNLTADVQRIVQPLVDRLTQLEGALRSGVLAAATVGSLPVTNLAGAGDATTPAAIPANEAELRERLAKLPTHAERAALLNAYKAEQQRLKQSSQAA